MFRSDDSVSCDINSSQVLWLIPQVPGFEPQDGLQISCITFNCVWGRTILKWLRVTRAGENRGQRSSADGSHDKVESRGLRRS